MELQCSLSIKKGEDREYEVVTFPDDSEIKISYINKRGEARSCVALDHESQQKFKFREDGVESQVAELDALLYCKKITQEEYDRCIGTTYTFMVNNSTFYGMEVLYVEGETLHSKLLGVIGNDSPEGEKPSQIIAWFQKSLAAYRALDVLPFDFSPGNIIFHDEEGVPIDFGDCYKKNKAGSLTLGSIGRATVADKVVEGLLQDKPVARYNHRFFYAFHRFLYLSLGRVVSGDRIKERYDLDKYLNPDIIPTHKLRQSTENMFCYYQALLSELQGVGEQLAGSVPQAMWKEVLALKKIFLRIQAKYPKACGEKGGNMYFAKRFTDGLPVQMPPTVRELNAWLRLGRRALSDLVQQKDMRLHRQAVLYRKGEERALSSMPGWAVMLIALTVLGIFALFILRALECAKTSRQKLLEKGVSSCLSIQAACKRARARRLKKEKAALAGDPVGEGVPLRVLEQRKERRPSVRDAEETSGESVTHPHSL
jgi:hypothetical protein